LLIAIDTLVISASVVAAYFARFELLAQTFPPPGQEPVRFASHAIPFLGAVPVLLVSMLWSGLYSARRERGLFDEVRLILKAVIVGMIVIFTAATFFRNVLYEGRDPSRLQFVLCAGILFIALTLWRVSFRSVLRIGRRRGWNLRHVAIIGTGRLGQITWRKLHRNAWTGIKPAYFISHLPTTLSSQCLGAPVLGGLNDLERVLDASDISGIFLALPGEQAAQVPDLLMRLSRFPIDVRYVPDMNPRHMLLNMTVGELDGLPVLSVRESPLAGWGAVLKRIVDVIGAIVALAIFAIPMFVLACLIRLSGPGPVIYTQDRVSLNGRRFRILKFRSMKDESAPKAPTAPSGTAAWTTRGDPRITPVGSFMRRTSLDELPQLLNVLRGDMSLVGPRPERPELIEDFRNALPGYVLRQNVKAGMTGWAQVNGLRGDSSLERRLRYDLFYVGNWSLLFDLRILFLTLLRGFVHANAH